MAGKLVTTPIGRRNFGDIGSIGGMIFGFWDENEELPESSCDSGNVFEGGKNLVREEEEEEEDSCNVEENKAFWESQQRLLEATLRRTSSFEAKIREATKKAFQELELKKIGCICRKPKNGCQKCMRREICNLLQIAGFNSSICMSQWNSSPHMPSGTHTYIEVNDNSSPTKVERRVVIELHFRAEFEMARASEEYNQLIQRLPTFFVGKAERLRTLIKILCSAAKKSMKDKKIHMAPWRKQKYMQAKWHAKCEEKTLALSILPAKNFVRPPKQRASMLTFDLVKGLPSLHRMEVKVV